MKQQTAKHLKQMIIGITAALSIMTGILCAAYAAAKPVYTIIPAPITKKASARSIRISWSSSQDSSVEYYYVMRRSTLENAETGAWQTIAAIKSDCINGGSKNTYTDQLNSSKPQQYAYKICTLSKYSAVDTRSPEYEAATDQCAALGTNIKICIDPGHFGTLNNNYEYTGADGRYPYSEAEFMLKAGTALQKELRDSYGIDSYMTRTTDTISLTYKKKTYANEILDNSHISIRGAMAKKKGCDFFISLHTNSTSSAAAPWNQPKRVNKTFVIVNQAAHASGRGMQIANAIGLSLTDYNRDAGIQTSGFTTKNINQAVPFTNALNDALNASGTVVCRSGSSGADYYGVLRGSSADGIQGILVEHAFHSTKAMRRQAIASDDLYENWAVCDAYGIAYGFGFVSG